MLKIVLVGDSGVGSKTTVFERYCYNKEHSDWAPVVGVDCAYKNVVVDGIPLTLQVWGLFSSQSTAACVMS